jgi:HD-like signal output (HDOD) protein
MSDNEHFRFVQALAKDLRAGNIELPSLPAVVIKIRNLLDDEDSDFEKISKVVSVDSALASKIFVFANSALHNRSGEAILNLEVAIAKLGLDLVRSTAVALVVQQLTRARYQSNIAETVHQIWARSMRLSSMSHALAGRHHDLNDETAFMCGLLHDVGKLYILSKANEFGGLLEDEGPINEAIDRWYSQIGRCIVESWGFPADVVESMDSAEFLDDHIQRAPKMVDVVFAAGKFIDRKDGALQDVLSLPACKKLHLGEEVLPELFAAYKEKLAVVQQTLA